MNDLITVIFWNVRGRDSLSESIGELVHAEGADIVIVAESGADAAKVEGQLKKSTGRPFHFCPGSCQRLKVFSSYPDTQIVTIEESGHCTGRKLLLEEGKGIGIFALHLRSKLHGKKEDQELDARNALELLQKFERTIGHMHTVTLGDFNMDPFENTMTSVLGFHAVLDREIASRHQRTVQGKEYAFFYNPMWSLMGDISSGPPGSYYYDDSGALTYYWHMFDQVLVRPSLVNALVIDRLRIIDRIGNKSLLKHHKPDGSVFSDHLPLSVSFSKSKVPQ